MYVGKHAINYDSSVFIIDFMHFNMQSTIFAEIAITDAVEDV